MNIYQIFYELKKRITSSKTLISYPSRKTLKASRKSRKSTAAAMRSTVGVPQQLAPAHRRRSGGSGAGAPPPTRSRLPPPSKNTNKNIRRGISEKPDACGNDSWRQVSALYCEMQFATYLFKLTQKHAISSLLGMFSPSWRVDSSVYNST